MLGNPNIFIETATSYQMMVTADRQIARQESIEIMFTQVLQKRTSLRKWKDRGIVAGIGRQVKSVKSTLKKTMEITSKIADRCLLYAP